MSLIKSSLPLLLSYREVKVKATEAEVVAEEVAAVAEWIQRLRRLPAAAVIPEMVATAVMAEVVTVLTRRANSTRRPAPGLPFTK